VTLLKIYGTKSFAEAVEPTLKILDAGGPSWYIDTGSRKRIDTGVDWYADLAVTFRKLVEAEERTKGKREQKLQAVADRFYRGDIADALEQWYIEQGSFLRKQDLAAHTTLVEAIDRYGEGFSRSTPGRSDQLERSESSAARLPDSVRHDHHVRR
jgi:gamma-glutamyltranspeptidase/glutathione hydrolase